MTKAVLLLPALLVLVSGCVVTYGNFPDVKADALPKHQVSNPVSYHVGRIPTTLADESPKHADRTIIMIFFPNLYPLAMKDWGEAGRKVIGKTLEISGMFSEVLAIEEPPLTASTVPYNKSLHIDINFDVNPPSSWTLAIAQGQMAPGLGGIVFPPLLLFAFQPIPYYSGEGGLRVEYALYREGTRQAAYQYTIKKKGWGGIFLLPLAWLNYFTDDLKDALRATTLQFLIDAHRDGNL